MTSFLVATANEINRDWFGEESVIGVTAGASAPEVLVKDVISKLRGFGAKHVEVLAAFRKM